MPPGNYATLTSLFPRKDIATSPRRCSGEVISAPAEQPYVCALLALLQRPVAAVIPLPVQAETHGVEIGLRVGMDCERSGDAAGWNEQLRPAVVLRAQVDVLV